MNRKRLSLILLGCSVLAGVPMQAQTTPAPKVGPKEPIAPAPDSKDAEIDRMFKLVTMLKAEVPNIKDPAAKAAAECNLDLWHHMLDKMVAEQTANNEAAKKHVHHHGASEPHVAAPPKAPVPKPAGQ